MDQELYFGIAQPTWFEQFNRTKFGTTTARGGVKHYPLVRILNLLPSHDGTVRNVRIIKADKSKIVVGINTLAPLELSAEPIANSLCNEQPAEVVSQPPGSRPQREAAL